MSISKYYAPTEVYFGKDAELSVGEALLKYGYKKILLHYGTKSVIKSGLLQRVKDILDKEGIEYIELGGVVPNPRISLVRKGIEIVKTNNIPFILAVGGGSVIDSAKAIAYGVYGDFDIADLYSGKATAKGSLPIGTILTLSATGSEMSDSAVITNDEVTPYDKRGYNSNYSRPVFSLLNPELTYSVSKYQTASGTVDIMMHTLERFFHPGYTLELTDNLAMTLLKEIIKNGLIAYNDPTNYEARANLMWGSSLSHNGLMHVGFEVSGDWACHQFEHSLSAIYDVAHGAGLAAIWASWARYVFDVDPSRFALLGRGVFGLEISDDIECGQKAIRCFEDFFRKIDMPTNLKELGLTLGEKELRELAMHVTRNNTRTFGNFKKLGLEDSYIVYVNANK